MKNAYSIGVDIYQKVTKFYQSFEGQKRVIGKSLLGRNLYAVKVGEGAPVGLAQYALHGREYITAMLALRHVQIGVKEGSLWLLPLCNPDGALLSQVGLESVFPASRRRRLTVLNGGREDFSLWKANARGVDLNVNFDAEWGKGAKNRRFAGSENYIGSAPFSEPETQALKRFTLKIKPDYTVSYHTKGEEIYWYFYQSISTCLRDKRLAMALSSSTGYPLAYAKDSVGGYKDWCISALGIPSFTIEAGPDSFSHPLGQDALLDIIKKNEYALYQLSGEIFRQ